MTPTICGYPFRLPALRYPTKRLPCRLVYDGAHFRREDVEEQVGERRGHMDWMPESIVTYWGEICRLCVECMISVD